MYFSLLAGQSITCLKLQDTRTLVTMTGYKGPSHRNSKEETVAECRTCGPPYVFKHKGTEHLFQDYSFHIRRVTVSSLLGIYILLTAVLAILYFAYQRRPSEKNIYHISLCVLGIILYVYINTKYLRTRRQLKVVSYLLWILLLLFAFISFPLGAWINGQVDSSPVYPAEGMWQLLFIIYCMYLLLPVNFFMTLVFGVVLSLVHCAVVMIRLQNLAAMKDNWTQVSLSCSCVCNAMNYFTVLDIKRTAQLRSLAMMA